MLDLDVSCNSSSDCLDTLLEWSSSIVMENRSDDFFVSTVLNCEGHCKCGGIMECVGPLDM